jgi:hypothetical protein
LLTQKQPLAGGNFMKNLFIFLSLVLSMPIMLTNTAKARSPKKLITWAESIHNAGVLPNKRVNIYADGSVLFLKCGKATCTPGKSSKLNNKNFEDVSTAAEQTLKLPKEKPKTGGFHCDAISDESRNYFVVDAKGADVKVATGQMPCGPFPAKNASASVLVDAFNMLFSK